MYTVKTTTKTGTSFYTGELSKTAALQVFKDLANNPQTQFIVVYNQKGEKQTFTPKQLGAIKMAIQISTSNEVILDQQHTGFHVKQGDTHTRLVSKSGEEISLPSKRYSLVSNNPGGDAQGLDQFEIDFKAATGA